MKVVIGIFAKDGKLLMGKRPDTDAFFGGHWEFPGGKVEKDETDEAALIREFEEELGTKILSLSPYKQIHWQYPTKTVDLHFYKIELNETDLNNYQKNAHSELAWLTPEETKNLKVLPANRDLLKNFQF